MKRSKEDLILYRLREEIRMLASKGIVADYADLRPFIQEAIKLGKEKE
jgi:hypothetical protein